MPDSRGPQMSGPYHVEAHGLNGEMLDGLLKAAFTEGALAGWSEAGDQFGRVRADAYDEGEHEGRRAGAALVERFAAGAREELDNAVISFSVLRDLVNDSARLGSSRKAEIIARIADIERHFRSAAGL